MAVRPAILSNKSLEPTAPSRFALRGAEEEGEEGYQGVRVSGGGLTGRGVRLLVLELGLRVLEAAAQLQSVSPASKKQLGHCGIRGDLWVKIAK